MFVGDNQKSSSQKCVKDHIHYRAKQAELLDKVNSLIDSNSATFLRWTTPFVTDIKKKFSHLAPLVLIVLGHAHGFGFIF